MNCSSWVVSAMVWTTVGPCCCWCGYPSKSVFGCSGRKFCCWKRCCCRYSLKSVKVCSWKRGCSCECCSPKSMSVGGDRNCGYCSSKSMFVCSDRKFCCWERCCCCCCCCGYRYVGGYRPAASRPDTPALMRHPEFLVRFP